MHRFLFIFSLIALCLLIINAASANAQTMSNQDYILNLNPISNTATTESAIKPPKDTDPETKTDKPFSIWLSSNIVNFGDLIPTNPIIRNVDLSIENPPIHGYSVFAYENEPLKSNSPTNKMLIPNTTCDNGQCSAQNASEWTNVLTFGFGYRCDNLIGTNCDRSFASHNFYKRFPNLVNNDTLQTIMSGIESKNIKARISYKVNISKAQKPGKYTNVITYIAVPSF
jgi:hypothetical protein